MINRIKDRTRAYADRLIHTVRVDIGVVNSRLDGIENRVMSQTQGVIMPINEKMIIARIFSGLKICLDPRDVALVPHLAIDGIWEESMTKAWLSQLAPNQVVMDIGANFGYYGLLAAQQVYSKGQKTIFFEANPDLIDYIKRTLSINGLHEFCVVENLAIADKKGNANLTILDDFIACSTLHTEAHLDKYLHGKMPISTAKTVQVSTVTIDEYCLEKNISKVDLVKLDIEGFEENAYQGMKNTIATSPNLIVFLEFTAKSYENPAAFYKQISKDFKYIYTINDQGGLEQCSHLSYVQMFGPEVLFKMIVISNKKLA